MPSVVYMELQAVDGITDERHPSSLSDIPGKQSQIRTWQIYIIC